MQAQKVEYEQHKPFYDKLIAFHKKIEQLKQLKEEIVQKNAELTKANDRLQMKIEEVKIAKGDKEKQDQHLKELLAEVKEIQRLYCNKEPK